MGALRGSNQVAKGRVYFFIYRIFCYLLLPVVLVHFLIRGLGNREYRYRLSERFGWIPSHVCAGSIWVHAVSVGEVNAVRPLVEHLLDRYEVPVLLSCVTPTGSAQITRHFGDRVSQVYAPIDVGIFVRRMLRAVQPCSLIIAETELWPNLLHVSHASNVPTAFVNLRISDQTFNRALYFSSLCQYVLKDVSSFCAQTALDAERIVALGVAPKKVSVTGNLKFDMAVPEGIQDKATDLRERWGGEKRPTIVLGSSHENEEIRFMEVVMELRVQFPQLVALIVPRHPERFARVYRQISNFGLVVVRYSQGQKGEMVSADVILVDVMGQLLEFYAASDVAIVGGGFATQGGHNILEPILVGTPPVFGPEVSNFREIAQLVLDNDAGDMVENFDELKETLSKYLADSQARQARVQKGHQLLNANQGALQRAIKVLNLLLE